jgi:hypothetical protein
MMKNLIDKLLSLFSKRRYSIYIVDSDSNNVYVIADQLSYAYEVILQIVHKDTISNSQYLKEAYKLFKGDRLKTKTFPAKEVKRIEKELNKIGLYCKTEELS